MVVNAVNFSSQGRGRQICEFKVCRTKETPSSKKKKKCERSKQGEPKTTEDCPQKGWTENCQPRQQLRQQGQRTAGDWQHVEIFEHNMGGGARMVGGQNIR